jgi:ABC-type amino acid transport substrate-binding protein
VDFSRAYVPYAQVVAVPAGQAGSVTSADQLNESRTTITVLQGSTGETLAKQSFREVEVRGFPYQDAAFLEVATGPAGQVVVEDYLLAQFQTSNPDQLEQTVLGEPLQVEYGAWAMPKGSADLVAFLDEWLCEKQADGTLEKTYKQSFQVDEMPPMPTC